MSDMCDEKLNNLDLLAAHAMPVVAELGRAAIDEYVEGLLAETHKGEIPDARAIFTARAHGLAFYSYELAEAMLVARKVFLEDE